MIKSLKVKENLYVNALPITLSKKQEKEVEMQARKEIIILDRSGSMQGYLNSIMNSVTTYCEKLPEGSEIMLGYFSGNNEYSLSVPYILKKELGQVTTTLNSYKSSLGMTCYPQILSKVNEVAKKSNDKRNLFFFSDGAHNTGGSWKDIEVCLKEWGKYAQVTCFVGCGYIDREKMSLMASITDGSFIHLNSFNDFSQSLTDFGESVEDSVPSVEVTIDFTNEEIIPISLAGEVIVEYSVIDRKVKFKASKKGYKGLFFLTQNKIKNAEEVTELDITFEKGIRALATIHSQKNDALTALDLLNFIGDKYLVSTLYSSITPEEYALSESKIRRTVFRSKERYLEGVVKNFLPDPNAFCVLDAINILSQDEDAKIYIHDKDFEYTRIGRAQVQTDGPKVEYDKEAGSKLGSIVMHKERLNLSINTVMKGTVPLVPAFFKNNPFLMNDLQNLNLPSDYPVNTFKTYTIVADGKLQTKKLVLSDLSKDTINKLGSVITRRKDGKYVLDLTPLPVINKSYAKMDSAKELAKLVWSEKLLSDQISFYNYLRKEEEVKLGTKLRKEFGLVLSDEATQFLEDHCYLKGDNYGPPLEPVIATDMYLAPVISIDIKGFSKVAPKDIAKKLLEKKKTTTRELIIEECFGRKENFGTGEATLICLDAKIRDLNFQLWPIRKQIQLSKFAVILANKGKFLEFKERGTNTLSVEVKSLNGVKLIPEFIFKIESIEVKV